MTKNTLFSEKEKEKKNNTQMSAMLDFPADFQAIPLFYCIFNSKAIFFIQFLR